MFYALVVIFFIFWGRANQSDEWLEFQGLQGFLLLMIFVSLGFALHISNKQRKKYDKDIPKVIERWAEIRRKGVQKTRSEVDEMCELEREFGILDEQFREFYEIPDELVNDPNAYFYQP